MLDLCGDIGFSNDKMILQSLFIEVSQASFILSSNVRCLSYFYILLYLTLALLSFCTFYSLCLSFIFGVMVWITPKDIHINKGYIGFRI